MILSENRFTCRHALLVDDGAFSHKIEYVTIFLPTLNLEGHPNCITGSKFTMTLLKGWILLIGGASAVEGLRSTGLSRQVFLLIFFYLIFIDFFKIILRRKKSFFFLNYFHIFKGVVFFVCVSYQGYYNLY